MSFSIPLLARLTRGVLCLRWLVLAVLTFGAVASSIGLIKSHGVVETDSTHKSAALFSETTHVHGHEHAAGYSLENEGSSGGHDHHAMDHSHDTTHHLSLAWDAMPPNRPSWVVFAPAWSDTGQIYRLDRPPMG